MYVVRQIQVKTLSLARNILVCAVPGEMNSSLNQGKDCIREREVENQSHKAIMLTQVDIWRTRKAMETKGIGKCFHCCFKSSKLSQNQPVLNTEQ